MKPTRLLCVLLATTASSLPAAALPGAAASYRLLKEIPGGGDGGWDYLTVAPPGPWDVPQPYQFSRRAFCL